MELLTGADLSRLSGNEIERVVYQQILHQSKVQIQPGLKVTISMTLQVGELSPLIGYTLRVSRTRRIRPIWRGTVEGFSK